MENHAHLFYFPSEWSTREKRVIFGWIAGAHERPQSNDPTPESSNEAPSDSREEAEVASDAVQDSAEEQVDNRVDAAVTSVEDLQNAVNAIGGVEGAPSGQGENPQESHEEPEPEAETTPVESPEEGGADAPPEGDTPPESDTEQPNPDAGEETPEGEGVETPESEVPDSPDEQNAAPDNVDQGMDQPPKTPKERLDRAMEQLKTAKEFPDVMKAIGEMIVALAHMMSGVEKYDEQGEPVESGTESGQDQPSETTPEENNLQREMKEAMNENPEKLVQNTKIEAAKERENEANLESQYREIGEKIDAIRAEAGDDSSQEQRAEIRSLEERRRDIGDKLTTSEKRSEALEKEQQRREELVASDWENATKNRPENPSVQKVELGGDGDDLVITLKEGSKRLDAAANLDLRGVSVDVKARTITIDNVTMGLWLDAARETRVAIMEALAKIAEPEDEKPAPASEVETEAEGSTAENTVEDGGAEEEPAQIQEEESESTEEAQQQGEVNQISERTDVEWQGIQSLIDAHGQNPDMLGTLDEGELARMKQSLEQFVGVVNDELRQGPDEQRADYVEALRNRAQDLIARIDNSMANQESSEQGFIEEEAPPPESVPSSEFEQMRAAIVNQIQDLDAVIQAETRGSMGNPTESAIVYDRLSAINQGIETALSLDPTREVRGDFLRTITLEDGREFQLTANVSISPPMLELREKPDENAGGDQPEIFLENQGERFQGDILAQSNPDTMIA